MMSQKERKVYTFLGVAAVVGILIAIIWSVTRPPGNAGYVWSARRDVLELQRRVDRSFLSAEDITWLIERDNITVIHALIDYAWRNLTSEHIERLFSDRRLSFSGQHSVRNGTLYTYNLTQTGANFSTAMNRAVMSERQLMMLANNLRTGGGISGKDARHLILLSNGITPVTFRLAVIHWRYDDRFMSSGDWSRCSFCDELFGEAFERMMNSQEFRELPLINERDPTQSQYGVVSHVITLRDRPSPLPPEPIRRWLSTNRVSREQIVSVAEWYEYFYGDF